MAAVQCKVKHDKKERNKKFKNTYKNGEKNSQS